DRRGGLAVEVDGAAHGVFVCHDRPGGPLVLLSIVTRIDGYWSVTDGHDKTRGASGSGRFRTGPNSPAVPGRIAGRQRPHLRLRHRDAAAAVHLFIGSGV